MKKKYIRWLFLVAFVVFVALIKQSGLLNSNPSMFIVLWLFASYTVVFGVVYFRDKEAAEEISADVNVSETDTAKR